MKADEIRHLLNAKPFRPFYIKLAEGRKARVFDKNFAMISPGGQTLLAYENKTHYNLIDIGSITGIEVNSPTKKKNGRSPPSIKS